MLYKITFYVSIITACLTNQLKVLDRIPHYKYNKKALLKKIYQMKKSYIYIIEMTGEINNFMSATIITFESGEKMMILLLFYVCTNNFSGIIMNIWTVFGKLKIFSVLIKNFSKNLIICSSKIIHQMIKLKKYLKFFHV